MDSEIHDQGYEKAKISNLEQDGSDVNVLAIVLGLTGHIGSQSYLTGLLKSWVGPGIYKKGFLFVRAVLTKGIY